MEMQEINPQKVRDISDKIIAVIETLFGKDETSKDELLTNMVHCIAALDMTRISIKRLLEEEGIDLHDIVVDHAPSNIPHKEFMQ